MYLGSSHASILVVSFVKVSFAFIPNYRHIMSANPASTAYCTDTKHAFSSEIDKHASSGDSSIDRQKEVFDAFKIDSMLAQKMALINEAIEEIGMTPFQWKLFFLNGFGYAVDSVSSNAYFFYHCLIN